MTFNSGCKPHVHDNLDQMPGILEMNLCEPLHENSDLSQLQEVELLIHD